MDPSPTSKLKLIPDEDPLYEFTKEAAAFVGELNAAWEKIQQRRKQLDSEGQRLAALDPVEFTPADVKAKKQHREQTIEVLRGEIPIWKKLLAWPELRTKERHAAHDRAVQSEERAIAAARKKLAAAGFDATKFAE